MCDKYATRQMYGYCPSWALSWEYRKKVMVNVIYCLLFFHATLVITLPLIEFTWMSIKFTLFVSQAILDEIRHYSADIISLQEVETEQFHNFFKPELANDGFEGIFSPKSRAKTMGENERKYVDGCAIFFRTSK